MYTVLSDHDRALDGARLDATPREANFVARGVLLAQITTDAQSFLYQAGQCTLAELFFRIQLEVIEHGPNACSEDGDYDSQLAKRTSTDSGLRSVRCSGSSVRCPTKCCSDQSPVQTPRRSSDTSQREYPRC